MSSAPVELVAQVPEESPGSRQGLRAVIQSVASKVAILALQAGTGILTARTLGPAGRGELAAMSLWPLFVASVTTLRVPSFLIYYLRHCEGEREKVIANGVSLAAVMDILAAVGCSIILPWWLHEYTPTVVHAAEWFLITVPICSVTLAGRAVLEAAHDFPASNALKTHPPHQSRPPGNSIHSCIDSCVLLHDHAHTSRRRRQAPFSDSGNQEAAGI